MLSDGCAGYLKFIRGIDGKVKSALLMMVSLVGKETKGSMTREPFCYGETSMMVRNAPLARCDQAW